MSTLPLHRNLLRGHNIIPGSLILCGILALTLSVNSAAGEADSLDQQPAADSAAIPMYIIETRHRLFPDFLQVDTVYGDEKFYIGEDNYEAHVLSFNPHLGITEKGEVLQMSDTLYNPAVHIRVMAEDSLLQESWGFYLTEKPHYFRNELLGFVLREFDVGEKYARPPMRLK